MSLYYDILYTLSILIFFEAGVEGVGGDVDKIMRILPRIIYSL